MSLMRAMGKRQRKILITGGAGFIGSHLAERLLADGAEVSVIDDLSTGRYSNMRRLRDCPYFHFHKQSVVDEPSLKREIAKCDIVYHLAAAVGVDLIIRQPVKTIETNIYGTELVLKHAAQGGKPVVLASSSEIYGKNRKVPFKENDDMLLGPVTKSRWSYACSKAVDEFLALAYHKEKGLPVVILRFFNIVGPRQVGDYGMVLPRFIDAALRGEPLRVFGSGRQVRCFLDVEDLVEVLVKIVGKRRASGKVFNVGGDRPVTINALARIVIKRIGSKSKIVRVPYDRAYEKGFEDLQARVPDISALKKLLGFRPRRSLEETIDRIAGASVKQ